MLEGCFLNLEYALAHPGFEDWRSRNPREWGALLSLGEDELVTRVIAAIVSGRQDTDEALDELTRVADGIESHTLASLANTLEPLPGVNQRRSFVVKVRRMKRVTTEDGTAFRVDFVTNKGWSGYFDTTAPEVVERIAKHRRRGEPLTVVGEVVDHPHSFMVVLGGRVKIV